MSDLQNADLDHMNRSGRLFMLAGRTGQDPGPLLTSAATLLAAANGPAEYRRLLWWWDEGTRDYCYGADQVDSLRALLMDTARSLAEKESR